MDFTPLNETLTRIENDPRSGQSLLLYALVMEFASPTFLAVPLSLSIVIWCAVGGRGSLIGAALGAILVTGVQGNLSESPAFLDTWMLIMGFIFGARTRRGSG